MDDENGGGDGDDGGAACIVQNITLVSNRFLMVFKWFLNGF